MQVNWYKLKKKEYALTLAELRSVWEIRRSPIDHLKHLWIANKKPVVASDKEQFPQSNKLVKNHAVCWMYHPHWHINLNSYGKKGCSTRVQSREVIGASLPPQRNPAKLMLSYGEALGLSKTKLHQCSTDVPLMLLILQPVLSDLCSILHPKFI